MPRRHNLNYLSPGSEVGGGLCDPGSFCHMIFGQFSPATLIQELVVMRILFSFVIYFRFLFSFGLY